MCNRNIDIQSYGKEVDVRHEKDQGDVLHTSYNVVNRKSKLGYFINRKREFSFRDSKTAVVNEQKYGRIK